MGTSSGMALGACLTATGSDLAELASWIEDGLGEETLTPPEWAVLPAVEHLLSGDAREILADMRESPEDGREERELRRPLDADVCLERTRTLEGVRDVVVRVGDGGWRVAALGDDGELLAEACHGDFAAAANEVFEALLS